MVQESSYHVFLSFKGEIRNKFICFLYDALRAEGFKTFMDTNDIQVGDELDLSIREGIRGSMSAIIVFSENYAFSTWCLDELVLILERKKTSRYFIVPIFYEVEPADIKHQRGTYGAALEKHKGRHQGKVQKWKNALDEVGNIRGKQVEGKYNIFIENIVKLYREKLFAEFPEYGLLFAKNLVLHETDNNTKLESQRRVANKDLNQNQPIPTDPANTAKLKDPDVGASTSGQIKVPFESIEIEVIESQADPLIGYNKIYLPNGEGKNLVLHETDNHTKLESQGRVANKDLNQNQPMPTDLANTAKLEDPHVGASTSGQIKVPFESIEINVIELQADPLIGCKKICPPNGEGKIVLYTISGGYRGMVKDCKAVQKILEANNVKFDNRDTMTNLMYHRELKKLVDTWACPRLFVAGRDIGELRKVGKYHKARIDDILKCYNQQKGNPSSAQS